MQLDPETLEVVSFVPVAALEPQSSVLVVGAQVSEPDICHVWFSDCAACF